MLCRRTSVPGSADSVGPRQEQLAPTTIGWGFGWETLEYGAARDIVRAKTATDLNHNRPLVTASDLELLSAGCRLHFWGLLVSGW